jgi:hypothetical protein
MTALDKRMVFITIILLMLLTGGAWAAFKLASKQHQGIDCHKVKETCDRKKGCKCKLNCDSEGKRLPPAGGLAECPSFCCEEKCECHAMGCP